MIKEIIIHPEKVIQGIISGDKVSLPKNKWSLISIYNSNEKPLINDKTILPDNCVKKLSICFFDCTPNEWGTVKKFIPQASKERDLFNKKHAEQIIKFLDSLDIETSLLINCAAGISRSGAVGLFASRYLNIEERSFRKMNPNICPNPHVIDILNNVSGINDSYKKFWSIELKKNDTLRNIFRLRSISSYENSTW